MGLFDFIQDAGEALTEKAMGSTASEDLTKTAEIPQERLDQLRGEQIAGSIAKLDVEGEDVSVTVQNGIATLTGSAPSQEALEKMVLCAGNQFGIGQVDCQLNVPAEPAAAATEAPTAEASAAFYTVKSGDTLGKIAQAHYGSAGKYMAIFEANQPMLTDPDKIYPGQQLRIPAA